MAENFEQINKGFRILQAVMGGYIAREMTREYGSDRWWGEVLQALNDQQNLPTSGSWQERVDSLDIANCLRLFQRKWKDIFSKKHSLDYRNWANELMGIRNKTAHIGGGDFSRDNTWRALDTMARLCEAFDDEAAGELRDMARELLYGPEGSTAATTATPEPPPAKPSQQPAQLSGLPSWREVMEPNPDVAEGRYRNAEFAANLAEVARGQGSPEYRDPVEFFNRTYVTEGMKGLLVQAVRRVAGLDGEPVIQLKTAFGGGKTHSMLALYHLLRGTVPAQKLSGIAPVLAEAGVTDLPKVKVAVLVGTALDPTKPRRPNHLPGITINTLWGEMAAQLAEAAGDLDLYKYVKAADSKGVSPGHEALKDLFDACGPCLILMDELVAYAKKLYGANGLPAGSFDNFITFIQEVTEAATLSQNSLVVASIPESAIEIGGESGQETLRAIEHTFGRMEAIWKPVTAGEGFEVVRRRLFRDCKDDSARERVCSAFSQLYQDNPGDFPVDARELEYKQRMISCYPIHPEVFDHLYEEWSTLDKFQRTRGVLRLMAAVIHNLWMSSDAGAMIMPGSLPMNAPDVRNELTRYLSEEWNGIVDKEIDGTNSTPFQKDREIARYGSRMASRRLARTIFLGSAPSARGQSVRGIDLTHIRLGTVQPGENIPLFNDALNTLQNSLSYLYAKNDRCWYDTRPTLRKTMEDRASQLSDDEVEHEIETRLKAIRKEPPFAGVHICPGSSLDVPDEQAARLVILSPQDGYKTNYGGKTPAEKRCEDILASRGTSPRIYKNTLVFLAPDSDGILSLKQEVRRYLAWKSIDEDKESLNLDTSQKREIKDSVTKSTGTLESQLKEVYCWLLSPYTDIDSGSHETQWEKENIKGGNDSLPTKASRKLEQNEALITRWAPALLLMKLDELLWKDTDELSVKKLWDYLCTYCYLPRLSGFSVLEDAIRSGVNSSEYFAYAEGLSDGRYLGLKFNEPLSRVDMSGYLVKLSAAHKQLETQAVPVGAGVGAPVGTPTVPPVAAGEPVDMSSSGGAAFTLRSEPTAYTATATAVAPPSAVPAVENTRFFLSTPLDITRINRSVNDLVKEVLNHLDGLPGSQVEIRLEVNAIMPEGTPTPVVRTVTENCRTLKVGEFGFEK